MNILLLGSNGQVGQAFQDLAKTDAFPIGWTLISWDRERADLSHPEKLIQNLRALHATKPIDAIINTAAYTKVDLAETEKELTLTINAEAPKTIARFCLEKNIPMVHFSSDYVYSGEGTEPHQESEVHQPLNHYGMTKAKGDESILQVGGDALIFRTSWVYSHAGQNFVQTMLKFGTEKKELKIVNDQFGAPTYAPDLAALALEALMKAMVKKVENGKFPLGIYHLCNRGVTNWAEFAETIFDLARQQGQFLAIEKVMGISSEEYPTPAKRPLNSRLSLKKIGEEFGLVPRPWAIALNECLKKRGTSHD